MIMMIMVTILVNNLSKINNGATFVGGFFLTVIFFIVKVWWIIINYNYKSITVAIVQLNINFAAHSSTDVAIGHAQVIHNVCAVFYFIFSFFILWGCKI